MRRVLIVLANCLLVMFLGFANKVAAQCAYDKTVDTTYPDAKLNPASDGVSLVSGTVTTHPDGKDPISNSVDVVVSIVRDGTTLLSKTVPVNDSKAFSAGFTEKVKGGDILCAQIHQRGGNAVGPYADPFTVPISCSATTSQNPAVATPEIKAIVKQEDGTYIVSGDGAKGYTTVRLCVDDQQVAANLAVRKDGTFESVPITLKEEDSVQVQISAGGQFTTLSKKTPTPIADKPSLLRDFRYSLIAGVDNFWYAAQEGKTNPFVQLFVESAEFKPLGFWSTWGSLKYLGTPQPATNGIGSTFTDPMGAVTKQDFSTVGTALDWQLGVQKYITRPSRTWGRFGAIASFGGTNPLSAQAAPAMFKTPTQGSYECNEILARFTPARGYPQLVAGDSQTASCLQAIGANGNPIAVTDIAFQNEDRSNTLAKWGVGTRNQWTWGCADAFSSCSAGISTLDITVGQDASMTRGQVRNFVGKVDGTFAIPTGKISYLYLYFSGYSRFKRNVTVAPLTLTADPKGPSIPNPDVVVLPLKQPDRDFFRVGIGLNVGQVLCKFSETLCNSSK